METVVITGAAGGIAEATLVRLIAAGCKRFGLIDVDAKRLNEVIERHADPALELVPLACDLQDNQAIKEAVHRFAPASGIDLLFANAGIMTSTGVFEDTGIAEIDRSITVNFRSVVTTTHAAWPHLSTAAGCVIVTASGAGIYPLERDVVYSASKAAAIMFAKANALRTDETGIRFNTICPGLVDTPILNDPATGEWREEVKRFARKFTIIKPAEIAAKVVDLFLNKQVNGEVVELLNTPRSRGN